MHITYYDKSYFVVGLRTLHPKVTLWIPPTDNQTGRWMKLPPGPMKQKIIALAKAQMAA